MNSRHTTAIVQARMGSSRLPGKVLLDIAGKPMLVRVVERACRASTIDDIVVATTQDQMDDPIAVLCESLGYACFRGSTFDVLDRYYQAARQFEADIIIRITADCPLIDPIVIDRTVQAFFGKTNKDDILLSDKGCSQLHPGDFDSFDFAANRLPPPWGRTYPIGLDTEVCTFKGLEICWHEAEELHQREHVMPFFYDHLERFRVLLVNNPSDFGKLRWTVDTSADLELIRKIFTFFPDRDDFFWLEILELFEKHPDLAKINNYISAKDYRQTDERLT